MSGRDSDNTLPTSGNINAEAPTEAMDYLVLKRSRIIYTKGGTNNWHGATLSGTTGIPTQGSVKKERKDGCVYLAMPPQLSTAYQPSYSQQNLGVPGMALYDAVNSGGMDGIAKTISDAAGAAMPEFTDAAASKIFQSFGNALGLAGQVDANSIEQMTGGRVFNPFSEQIFKSMNFRTHTFNIKMLARSREEAREIKNIIQWIKEGATPQIQAGSDSSLGALWDSMPSNGDIKGNYTKGENKDAVEGATTDAANDAFRKGGVSQRFFNIPDHFDLRFVRVNPEAAEYDWYNPASGNYSEHTGYNEMHFKIHSSFCNGVGINYTPDGQYTSFKAFDGSMVQVPAINLSLSFIETRLVSKQDVEIGF